MNDYLLSQRQKRILQALHSKQPISIHDLAQSVQMSDSTLRRNLQLLADLNLIVRQSGKVHWAFALDTENPFLLRGMVNEDEKQRIACAALELVHNGETIYISGGTTTLEFARLLPGKRRVTVITNSLPVANALVGDRNIKLVVLGGEVRSGEQTMHGHLALYGIEQLRADKLFYGIEAISLEHGLTHSQLVEVSTDRALINACGRTILLADHTKFGKVAPAIVIPVSQVHTIVTGSELAAEFVEGLHSRSVQVVLA
jgi:DeoR/GlpR family transcriptional regulator of sugar metabolism